MKTLINIVVALLFAGLVSVSGAKPKYAYLQSDKTLKSGQVKKDQNTRQAKKANHKRIKRPAISNKIAVSDQDKPTNRGSKGYHNHHKKSGVSNR